MNGIVVVDKPAEMTSAQVVAEVKTVLGARKVGHTGTLDPFATGVLVCCVNQATRLAQFLTRGKKCYQAVMRLGIRTDTHDFTGRVLSREASLAVTHSEVLSAFKRFSEVREQAPPAFSALKHHGMPLYKLARRGTLVQKPSRPIFIYKLVVHDIDLPDVRFEVRCSEGTYVRTLCADIGDALGCGAHLTGLRRTESGGFTLGEAVSLNTMKALFVDKETSKFVIPMREALRGIPEIQARRALAQKIRQGQPVTRMALGPLDDGAAQWIKVTDTDRHLIAVLDSKEKNGVLPYKCVFPNGKT
ncbi:MAG: tRNA pseudouridine(55) synthase TruB [Deltaproteobacteria bacterium]|jgi:tRNA pseudouridine55 synthase